MYTKINTQYTLIQVYITTILYYFGYELTVGEDRFRFDTEAVVSSSGYLIDSKFVVIGIIGASNHESVVLATSCFNSLILSSCALCLRLCSACSFSRLF